MITRFIAVIFLVIPMARVAPVAGAIPKGFSVLGTTVPVSAESIPIAGGFSEVLGATNTTLPPLSPADIARGYVLFVTNTLDPIYPYTRPLAPEITDPVDLCSVAGEYEPATFSIHALNGTNMTTVQVALTSTLTDPNGNTIHSENVDIRTVRTMPRWKSSSTYVISPTLMEQRLSVDIDQNKTQQYWITVWIPPGTSPGVYTATIQVTANGLDPATMNLEVEVLNITLLDPGTLHGMYYMQRDLANGNTPFPAGRLNDDYTNMGEHGMQTTSLSWPTELTSSFSFGKLVYDTSPLDPIRDAIAQSGIDTVIFNMSTDDIFSNPLASFPTTAKAYVDSLHADGWSTIIGSFGDESDVANPAPITSQLGAYHSVFPDELNYTTIVFPENSEVFEPHLDIRAFSSYVDDSVIVPTAAAGRQLWMYSGPSGYGLSGKAERLYRGIWTSIFGLAGVMDWTYFRPLEPTEPFNDLVLGHRNNMTCWVFPGVDGPLNSPGWEDIREGIEDEKYIFTLESLIEQANNSGINDLVVLATSAQNWLDQIYAQIDTSVRANNSIFPIRQEGSLLSSSFFTDFRKQAGVHIGLLTGAIDPQSCAEILALGLGLTTDINNDCYINLVDVSLIAELWMKCYDPANPACTLAFP